MIERRIQPNNDRYRSKINSLLSSTYDANELKSDWFSIELQLKMIGFAVLMAAPPAAMISIIFN